MRGSRRTQSATAHVHPFGTRRSRRVAGVLGVVLATGLVASTAQALVPAGVTDTGSGWEQPPTTLSSTLPTRPTSVPFSTSFEDGFVPQIRGAYLSYQEGQARTGNVSVLTDGPALSVTGLPVAWYDVSAWVRLPARQPESRMAWDGGFGAEVSSSGWTKVSGHAQAVGGVVSLSFDALCPMTVPDPWGFMVDDVALDLSKDQYPYPQPAVKCMNPLPSEPVAHRYSYDTPADLAAFSPDSRHVQIEPIFTDPPTGGSWLRVDAAVPGYGVRLRGLAPGAYRVSGTIRSTMSMGLTEESLDPRDAVKVPGGAWTPFTLLADTGEDGSLDLQVSNWCSGMGAAVVTSFMLGTLTVEPSTEDVPAAGTPRCPTTTTTKPTTTSSAPSTTSPTLSTPPTKTTKTKSTKVKPSKSTKVKPSKTKSTKVKSSKTKSVKPSCLFSYRVTDAWNDGFAAEMTVTSTTDLKGWTMTWVFPGDQQVTRFLIGYGTQKGATVSVTGNGFNPNVPAGQAVSVPFLASGSSTGWPTHITMNGVACYGGL